MILKEFNSQPFLKGGGEMGERIRTKDWSTTAIGTPDNWPQSLRTSINILLNSQFPMFVWWGKDELITFYNDAYRAIAGEKHPRLLGKSGHEMWAEIWDDLGPLTDAVFNGTSTWSEDQVLYMNRRGFTEETYFTFSYSPVFGDLDEVSGLFCACIETTEKVLARRRIEESERNLRNTILQAPAAMSILRGPTFVVEIANDRMYELWGRGKEELLNKSIFEGLPEVGNQGYEELLTGVFNTGKTFSATGIPVNLPRNGTVETVYINLVYQAFREGDGSISGIIAVATDVTEQVLANQKVEELVVDRTKELNHANQALQKINEDLKRSNGQLEEFAYAASHDLKEPIRKIRTFSDRLKSSLAGRLVDTDLHYFQRMERATERMQSLIDDLLDYSHVSTPNNYLEEVDLNKKVQQVLEDLELEVAEKNAKVIAGKLPVIKGHKRQMQQVFQNLITNALKFSKPGVAPEIRISASVVSADSTNSTSSPGTATQLYNLVEISDNGIGFQQEYADKIFQMFQRLHGKAQFDGTGIGLAIVRKVVENHKGIIKAESRPDEGATFKIFLPVT